MLKAPSEPGIQFSLGELADQLDAELIGDRAALVSRIGSLDSATPDTISFVSSARYVPQLASSGAGCVIVSAAHRDAAVARGATLVAADPYLCFARLTQLWASRKRAAIAPAIHASAVIHPGARLGKQVSVGPLAVIEDAAVVGDGAVIGAQCFVGEGASVGAQTRLASHVVLGWGCHIGARGVIHGGADHVLDVAVTVRPIEQ